MNRVVMALLAMTFLTPGILYTVEQQKDSNHYNNDIAMNENNITKQHPVENNGENKVVKYVLDNGMIILVLEVHSIPKVSLQIWYSVGSKDEKNGEKGIAHLIEHMIFKGTTGKHSLNLSESDINTISNMLSGNCNAFTTQDFTGYSFNMPTQNWKETLPIIADCMSHCAFKDDHLNSEMKAVIQELKMRRDKYALSLMEELLTSVLPDHPYHYPIIGYKQDLWSVNGKDLHKFYKKHYHPNNATLIVVGDVNPDEVHELSKKYFGSIKPNLEYKKEEFYNNKDIASKSVTLFRDINQPLIIAAFLFPGLIAKKKPIIDISSLLLGSGKGSRLYRKLVDELQLTTSLGCYNWDFLFEHSLFYFAFEPKNINDVNTILDIIQQEIDSVITEGLTEQEMTRAIKKAQMDYFDTLEDTYQQAFDIGKYFLATGDENYIFTYLNASEKQLQEDVRALLATHCRPSLMHVGKVLPLPDREKELWTQLQHASDSIDAQILSARARHTPVESPSYAKKVKINEPIKFHFPKAHEMTLSNGLKVLYYHNPRTPKIYMELRLKALSFYDPTDKQGLYTFMANMLTEGTEKYTAAQLADELETRGMSLNTYAGGATMALLNPDLHEALSLFTQVLTQPAFDEKEIEKVRMQLLAELKNFWDNPNSFVGQLIKERIYAGHPYSKNSYGTKENIAAINRDDLISLFKKFITPKGATLAIVGDLSGHDLKSELEATLAHWTGPEVPSIEFPALSKTNYVEVNYPINRDQVTLCFAGLSVGRKNPDYDLLFLFDQILAGGVLGSMKSRLFKLREQSGLFYGISGSLVAQANEQPGMILVKTLVSVDRLKEAEHAIKDTLAKVADVVTPDEFQEAKNAIVNVMAQYFESNASMAGTFLFLDRYNLPGDYFDTRIAKLRNITAEQMQDAVKRVLKDNPLSIFRVGRVEKK
ncbi:MAG TPA: pitrilysin family protein [Candidatus Babeliales bacterium]|nr:pitrilysin family protein [Candidatus Babeliales bacterium]